MLVESFELLFIYQGLSSGGRMLAPQSRSPVYAQQTIELSQEFSWIRKYREADGTPTFVGNYVAEKQNLL